MDRENQRIALKSAPMAAHYGPVPAQSRPIGYAALISHFQLDAPRPETLSAASDRHTYREQPGWRIVTPRYWPGDDIIAHLEYALRAEGVELPVLSALFRVLPPEVLQGWVTDEPTGQHARRAWFLFEWITGERLDLADAERGPYAMVLDPARYYTIAGETSPRHRIRNNLPGTSDFCPLVRRTDRLTALLEAVTWPKRRVRSCGVRRQTSWRGPPPFCCWRIPRPPM